MGEYVSKTREIEIPADDNRQPPWLIALLAFTAVFTICCVPSIIFAGMGGDERGVVRPSPSPSSQPSSPEPEPSIEQVVQPSTTWTPPPSPSRTRTRTATATPKPAPSRTAAAGTYYANCAAARAAGAAPLHRGDPGYRAALDQDGDGVGCDT